MKMPIFAYKCRIAFGCRDSYIVYVTVFDNGDLVEDIGFDQEPFKYKLKAETVDKIIAIIKKDYNAIKQSDEVIFDETLDGVENTFLFLDKEITDFNIEFEHLESEKLILKVFRKITKVLREEGYHLTLNKFWTDNEPIEY